MRSRRALLLIAPVLALAATAAPVRAMDLWAQAVHNDSMMEIFTDGAGHIRIVYQQPRPGLSVTPGTVLFEGRITRGTKTEPLGVEGLAYTFKTGCPAAPYKVTGGLKGDDLVLTGAAPRRDPGGCAVTGYATSGHSRLVFRLPAG